MRKYKYLILIILAVGIVFAGCTSNSGSDGNKENLPAAKGAESELYVVMDSAHWNGELGMAVKETFAMAIPGLPRDEPIFSMKFVNPLQFSGYLRHAKNLLFVTTLNNNSRQGKRMKNFFTEESLQMMQEKPEMYRFVLKDQYARGQSVLHLFGQNENQLIRQINENRSELQQVFLSQELKRLTKKIYSGVKKKGLMNTLLKNHDFFLNIPGDYKLAKERDNFLWIRHYTQAIDKNLVIYYQDYDDENVFEDQSIFELREKIAGRYLRDIEDSTIYMVTETLVPLSTKKINFGGKYAVETRGLWKLSDMSMGGPFLSYIFVDENRRRLYYIEGYVASPGKTKRETIRELEIILKTFKTREEYQELKSKS
ncbi:MAG: DUF4837 family protein [Cyclobacteriaceae bacterium]